MLDPQFESKLKSLRLSGIVDVLGVRNHEAVQAKLSYLEFLELLVDDELDRRKSRLHQRRIKQAAFAAFKTIEAFDFDFNKKINQRQIADLATCKFLYNAENIFLMGPPGVGKSHLAIAIGQKAIACGHNVRYFAADELAQAFAHAHVEDQTQKLLDNLRKAQLLIIDDLGLKRLPPAAGEYFLDVTRARYETASTIITSNRPFEDWGTILGDNATATTILDRLLHYAHTIQITGKSYRLANRITPSVSADENSKQPAKTKGRKRSK